MTRIRTLTFAVLASAALTLTACTASTPPDTGDDAADTGSAVATADATTDGEFGSATVTVDGRTWEYPAYWCITGYDDTDSDEYSFSSTSFITVDGETIQLLVDVRDDSGQDRVSGDGVVYEITVYDAENATVDVSVEGTTGVTITDTTVQADGTFTDVDGVSHSIQVDAVCGD